MITKSNDVSPIREAHCIEAEIKISLGLLANSTQESFSEEDI